MRWVHAGRPGVRALFQSIISGQVERFAWLLIWVALHEAAGRSAQHGVHPILRLWG